VIRAVCRAIVRASAPLAPRAFRARWLEEWRAEIDAARTSPSRLLARTAGAPVDALSARWTTRTARDSSGWRGPWQSDFSQTLRMLWRSPGHVAAVIGCLAIGMAANIAVLSIMNAIYFRELPGIEGRDRIVRLTVRYDHPGGRPYTDPFTRADFQSVRKGIDGLTEIAAESVWSLGVASPDLQTVAVPGAYVSGNYFNVFRTRPALGRLLQMSDEDRAAEPAVVLSHAFWSRHFNQRGDTIGRTLSVGGQAHTIIGITPEGFTGMRWQDVDAIQIFVPLSSPARFGRTANDHDPHLNVFGRLGPGETLESAVPKGGALTAMIASSSSGRSNPRVVIRRGLAISAREASLTTLAALAGPLLILAMGCANAANLQLARATVRLRELTLRLSLGASRLQIVRLVTMEAALLAVAASAAGLGGAIVVLRFAAPFFPHATPVDASVTGFTIAIVVAIVFGFGVVPGWLITADNLRRERRTARARNALVIAQVALSLFLLVVAALSVRTLQRLALQVPALADHIITADFRFDVLRYDADKARRFLRDLAQQIEARPDVEAVGFNDSGPETPRFMRYWLPGDPDDASRQAAGGMVSRGYFTATGLELRRGRIFDASETLTAVVVDEKFVREHQLPEPVIGTVLRVSEPDGTARPVTIVGVVSDRMEISGVDDEERGLYAPLHQAPADRASVFIRTARPGVVAAETKAAMAQLDPLLTAMNVSTRGAGLRRDLESEVFLAKAAGAVGLVALALAVAGVYAVVGYLVSLRTHEIGVRMAIGARPSDVVLLFLGDAGRLVLTGIAAGLAVSLPTVFILRSEFVGLAGIDPLAFAGSSAVLLAAGLLSALIPARRAAHIDPLVVLRQD
jgi:putative ABC transport system permease protein